MSRERGLFVDTGTVWLPVLDFPLSSVAFVDLPEAVDSDDVGRLRRVLDQQQGLYIQDVAGWLSVLGYAFPSAIVSGLPAAGLAGRLRRVTNAARGLWMDNGTRWFSLSGGAANVVEFGAISDGSTDSTSAIQAAIDAQAISGGVVLFPPGSYAIAAPLTVPTGVILRGGAQPASCRIVPTGGFAGDCFVRAEHRDDNVLTTEDQIQIENLGFVRASSTPDGFSAIDLTGACNSIIRNCWVSQVRSSAETDSMLRIADQNPTSSSTKRSQNNLVQHLFGTASRFLTLAQSVDGQADSNTIMGFEGTGLKVGLHMGGVTAGSSRLLLASGQLTASGVSTLAYDLGLSTFPLKLLLLQVHFSGFDATGDVVDETLFSSALAVGPSGTSPAAPLLAGDTLPQDFAGSVYVRIPAGTALAGGVNTFNFTLPNLLSSTLTFMVAVISGHPATPVSFQASNISVSLTLTIVAGGSVTLASDLVLRIIRVGP